MAVDPVLVWTAQLVLFGVFGGAVLHKLREPRRFKAILRDYAVLPDALAPAAATLAAALELLVVIGLPFPGTRAAAGLVAAALLAVYSAAIGLNLARGRTEIDCGCSWGGAGQPISASLILRNAGLLVGAALLGATPTIREAGLADALTALAAGAGLLLCTRTFETVLANAPAVRRLEDAGR